MTAAAAAAAMTPTVAIWVRSVMLMAQVLDITPTPTDGGGLLFLLGISDSRNKTVVKLDPGAVAPAWPGLAWPRMAWRRGTVVTGRGTPVRTHRAQRDGLRRPYRNGRCHPH